MFNYNPYYLYWMPHCHSACRHCQAQSPSTQPEMRIQLQEASLTYPTLTGIGNPAVERKLNTAICQKAMSLLPEPSPDLDIISAASNYDLKVLKNDIISLRLENYYYQRYFAHGMTYVTSLTANTQTSQIYQFEDLFNPAANYQEVLTRIIQQQIVDRQIPLINDYDGIKGNESFYLTEDSLVIYYQLYEYTPYYYGILEFPIPYTQIANLLNPNGPIARIIE